MDQHEEEIRGEEVPVQEIIRALMAGFIFVILGLFLIGSKPTIFQTVGVVCIAILVALVVYIWQEGKRGT